MSAFNFFSQTSLNVYLKIDYSFFYALICKIFEIKIYHFFIDILKFLETDQKKLFCFRIFKIQVGEKTPLSEIQGPLFVGIHYNVSNLLSKMLLDITLIFICIDLSQFYIAVLEIFTSFFFILPIFGGLPRKGGMQLC